MRFSRFAMAAISAALLSFAWGHHSHAQSGNTDAFNCAMLSGTPYLCLKNESSAPVMAVQSVAPGYGWFNPNAWIRIPGGMIPPGGAAVIKFPAFSHGCVQNVVIQTADSKTHYVWNTDVCHTTSIRLRWS